MLTFDNIFAILNIVNSSPKLNNRINQKSTNLYYLARALNIKKTLRGFIFQSSGMYNLCTPTRGATLVSLCTLYDFENTFEYHCDIQGIFYYHVYKPNNYQIKTDNKIVCREF